VHLLRKALYFFSEGLVGLWRHKGLHLFAIFVVALSLFVLGFSRYVTGNVSRLLRSWEQNLEVRVFLDPDASEELRNSLEETLSAQPTIASAAYVSPEQALDVLATIAPSFATLAEELPENPLPPSFALRLEGPMDPAAVRETIRRIEREEGVDEVLFDWDWVNRLRTYTRFAAFVGWVLFATLGFAALFTVAAIMRILALSRRDEIAILHFIGATGLTVRGPFVAGGALLGLLAGGVSLVLLALGHWLLRRDAGEDALLLTWISGTPLPWAEQAILAAGGALMGAVGGAVSLGSAKSWGDKTRG